MHKAVFVSTDKDSCLSRSNLGVALERQVTSKASPREPGRIRAISNTCPYFTIDSTLLYYLSMTFKINIRPRQQNPSRDILDEAVRAEIKTIVASVVHE